MFSYENQGTNTYLVYEFGQDEEIDSMSIGMITNNQILGLAPSVFTQKDTVKYIKYNISAKISVKQFFSGPVNRRRLLGVFNGIVAAMLSAEDYMIDESMILLDPEYIFADVSSCETVLICLPVQKKEAQAVDLGVFFKNIMFTTQFDPTENCDYVARIMNHLNSMPTFSLMQFKKLLDDLGGIKAAGSVKQNDVQTASVQPVSVPVQERKTNVVKQKIESVKGNLPNNPPQDVPAVQPDVKPAVQIPGKSPVNVPSANKPQVEEKAPADNGGEKMSLMYLLQHYNSDNAAAYKAQKEAKKQNSAASSGAPAASKASKKKEKSKSATSSTAPNFAIPGQSQGITPAAQTGGAQPVQPVQHVRPVQPVQPVKPVQHVQPVRPVSTGAQPAVVPIPSTEKDTSNPPVIPRDFSTSTVNFGETTVLGGGTAGETSVLTADYNVKRQVNPHLVRTKNNEIIPVNKPGFRIGKEKSYVDYFISDNTAVSRSHANINTRDGKYYVVDTNSTNHTYVDGRMIPSSTEVEITHGTKLRFANEDFEFKLY